METFPILYFFSMLLLSYVLCGLLVSSPISNSSSHEAQSLGFGFSWPDLNDGLFYNDVIRSSDSELTLIQLYSRRYKNSALLRGLPWKEPDAPHVLEILYEDGDMIALNKPSGLQVLPGGLFQQRTVLTQLQWQATKQSSSLVCQEPNPVPVHCLGRALQTKLAKTQLAAYFADGTSHVGGKQVRENDLFRCETNLEVTRRKILKIYRALVTGIICEDKVIVEQPIGRVQYPGVAKGLYIASPSGKPALSKVEILQRDIEKNCTLVEIQSGRPHEIRIHLSFIGHPLVGDPLYVEGGRPHCFDPEFVDESFTQDGGFMRPAKPVPGDCGYTLHAHQVLCLIQRPMR